MVKDITDLAGRKAFRLSRQSPLGLKTGFLLTKTNLKIGDGKT